MASIPRTGSSTLRKAKIPQIQCLRLESHPRSFSSTSHRSAAAARRLDLSRIAPKQQSVSSRVKSLRKSEMPTDIGLIPGTFIRPTWKEGPSLFSSKWRQRLFMDWFAIKQNTTDFIAMVFSYRYNAKDPETELKIKYPLDLRMRAKIACDMHVALYTAIAAGNKSMIKEMACSGLAQQQSARIDSRKLNDLAPERWGIKFRGSRTNTSRMAIWPLQFIVPNKAVKVVSDRQVNLPFGENATLRQYTVRIKSRQTLTRADGSPPTQKNMTEYLVIQRRIIDGEFEDWKVWGTTRPSTYEDAVEINAPLGEKEEGTRTSMWENIKMSFYEKMGGQVEKRGGQL